MLPIRLRDNIEELRHSLQPKESAIEALQQSILEKDQVRMCMLVLWEIQFLLSKIQSMDQEVHHMFLYVYTCR